MAVSAIGEDGLAALGRQDINALAAQVPNLEVNQYSPTITVFNTVFADQHRKGMAMSTQEVGEFGTVPFLAQPSVRKPLGNRPPGLTAYLVIGASILLGVSTTFTAPIEIASISKAYALGPSLVGSIVSLELLAIALTSLGLSPVLSKLPLRRLAAVSAVMALVLQLASMASLPIAAFVLARLLSGACCGVVYSAGCYWTARSLAGVRLFSVGLMLATIVYGAGMTVLPALVEQTPLVGLFGFTSLVSVAVIIALVSLRPPPSDMTEQIQGERRAILVPGAALLLITVVASNVGLQMLWTFSEFLGRERNLDAATIGGALAVSTIFSILGCLCAALLDHRLKLTFPLVAANLLGTLSAVLLATSTSSLAYGIGLSMYAAAFYFVLPYQVMAGAALDGTGRTATMAGALALLAGAAGPLLGGLLFESLPSGALSLTTAGLCLLAALGSIGLRAKIDHTSENDPGEIAPCP